MLAGEKKKDWKINPFSHSVHPTTSYSSTPGISAPSPRIGYQGYHLKPLTL